MNRLTKIALAALALLSFAAPANAASIWMCQGDVSGATTGTRTIGGTLSPVPSGSIYVLNGQGCALVAQGDVGYFQSQGFTQGSPYAVAAFTTGVLTGTTAVQFLPSLPAGAIIRDIVVSNTTANAVTGGIDIGTTSGGADIVSALTCAASCLTFVADSALLKRVFSLTAQQAIFVVGHTSGNSANLTITISYQYF
jgi:hypothetical protein